MAPQSHPPLQPLAYLTLFIGALLLPLLYGYPLYQDGDTHWHLAAGREILEQGQIPKTDPWTFSSDQQWYNISWLFDIAIALLSKTLGDSGLHLLTLSLHALLVAEIFRTLPAWGETSLEARFLAAALAAIGLNNYAVLRPQLLAFFLILYSLVLLQKSRTHPKLLWGLPLLTLLWANTHGSFPLLAIFFGAHGLEALLHKNIRRFQLLCLTALACSLTTLLNPLGLDIYTAISRTLDSSITPYISEWKGWQAQTNSPQGLSTLIFFVGLLFTSILLSTKTTPLTERITTCILILLATLSLRNFGFLAIGATPLICLCFQTLSNHPLLKSKEIIQYWLPTTALLLLLLAAVLNQTQLKTKFSTQNTPATFDIETCLVLQKTLPPDAKILNEYNIGGALVHPIPKAQTHYIDGRAGTAFSETILLEYINTFLKGTEPFSNLQEKYKPDAMVLVKHSREYQVLIPQLKKLNWKIIHTNKKNLILVPPHNNTQINLDNKTQN